LEDSGIQGLAPSVIIGYKYIRMERGKRDARFGRERRDARFGGERRDARFGDSEWLEDSVVQGACPFSHHRIYTRIQCRYLTNILSEDTVEEKVGNSKAKDVGKCKRAGQEHAVAIKCERKTGQNMPWRHGSITGDRVCSRKVSQDTWMMKTCKIKHMYENMQKQRQNNQRSH
jgi:hypothetical protein